MTFEIDHLTDASLADWLNELARQYARHYIETNTVATTLELPLASYHYLSGLTENFDPPTPLRIRGLRQLPTNLARLRT